MISQATYTRGDRKVTVTLDRIDTWIEDPESIVNFPGLVRLDGERLYMTYHRGKHGGVEPLRSVVSSDAGATWTRAPDDSPFIEKHPITGLSYVDFGSGILGYLRDGTIMRIDTYPVEYLQSVADRAEAPYLTQMQMDRPTFRVRRWTASGEPLEGHQFQVEGFPWKGTSAFENYSSLIELDNGDLLTVLTGHVGPMQKTGEKDWRGRDEYRQSYSIAIIRSGDGGRSWRCVAHLHPDDGNHVYGHSDRPLDEGFDETDIALLPNGDVLCIMRTGSYSPMFQARSSDGGHTWSRPELVGWQGVKPRLQVLPNGVLACAAGRGAYGHPQVTHVTLSLDGTGEHWEYPFAFHTGPGCSYTSTMQRDGKLHVIYSHSDFTREFGTNLLPSQTIRRAVLDVRVD